LPEITYGRGPVTLKKTISGKALMPGVQAPSIALCEEKEVHYFYRKKKGKPLNLFDF
jgi:hypothetical protein